MLSVRFTVWTVESVCRYLLSVRRKNGMLWSERKLTKEENFLVESTTAGTECSLECSVFVEPEVPGTSYAYCYWLFLVKFAICKWPVWFGFPVKSLVGVVLPAPSKLCVEEFSHAGKPPSLTLHWGASSTYLVCTKHQHCWEQKQQHYLTVSSPPSSPSDSKDGTGEEAERNHRVERGLLVYGAERRFGDDCELHLHPDQKPWLQYHSRYYDPLG